jgi:hypothetical protein
MSLTIFQWSNDQRHLSARRVVILLTRDCHEMTRPTCAYVEMDVQLRGGEDP